MYSLSRTSNWPLEMIELGLSDLIPEPASESQGEKGTVPAFI